MFEFDLEPEFAKTLTKIQKRSPEIALGINRKIKEIISRDKNSVMAYKNLRYDLKNYKRVHITKSLVMIFVVNTEKNHILFTHLKHRDDVYRK